MLRLARSFTFALSGLLYMVRTQPNFRVEIAAGLLAIAVGALLRLGPAEWAVLTLVISIVLILEGINTSLEIAVDLAAPLMDPRAKAAKDIAAGMVLLAAAASVGVAVALLLPRALGARGILHLCTALRQ